MDAEDFQPQSVSTPNRFFLSKHFLWALSRPYETNQKDLKHIPSGLSGYWSDVERINRHYSFHSVFRLNLGSHLCPSTH